MQGFLNIATNIITIIITKIITIIIHVTNTFRHQQRSYTATCIISYHFPAHHWPLPPSSHDRLQGFLLSLSLISYYLWIYFLHLLPSDSNHAPGRSSVLALYQNNLSVSSRLLCPQLTTAITMATDALRRRHDNQVGTLPCYRIIEVI